MYGRASRHILFVLPSKPIEICQYRFLSAVNGENQAKSAAVVIVSHHRSAEEAPRKEAP